MVHQFGYDVTDESSLRYYGSPSVASVQIEEDSIATNHGSSNYAEGMLKGNYNDFEYDFGAQLTDEWQLIRIPFADMERSSSSDGLVTEEVLATAKELIWELQVSNTELDLWIDDVAFYTELRYSFIYCDEATGIVMKALDFQPVIFIRHLILKTAHAALQRGAEVKFCSVAERKRHFLMKFFLHWCYILSHGNRNERKLGNCAGRMLSEKSLLFI